MSMRHEAKLWIALSLGFGLVSMRGLPATAGEPAAAKLECRLEKGDKAVFQVERSTQSQGEGPRGSFKQNEETKIEYQIEVGDKKENGDLVLQVKFGSVQAKMEGRESTWEFDSTKKAEDDAPKYLRDALGKTITVSVSGGEIKDVTGFPEPPRAEEGTRPGNRAYRGMSVLSRGAVFRDLTLILSSAAAGQTLEKGREYKLAPGERPSRGERKDEKKDPSRESVLRGAMLWFGLPGLKYRFEGEEKTGDEKTGGETLARFVLGTAERERGTPGKDAGKEGERRGKTEEKVDGTVLVCMKDGLVSKLEMVTTYKSERPLRDQGTFRTERKTKTVITRAPAPKGERK